MIFIKAPQRSWDTYGSGAFKASRGSRTHNGIDYVCLPEDEVVSPATGTVTKLGFCYEDDLSYRYVQVEKDNGHRHRVFYIDPAVDVGDCIVKGETILGQVQDICERYNEKPGMTPHIHYEVIDEKGEFINPENAP